MECLEDTIKKTKNTKRGNRMYNFKKIEKKWQEYWDNNESFKAVTGSDKKPYYILVEFPYPSGSGLHVGHVRSYTAQDALARMKRREGYNVLYPMGWDAFGAPAEQYAIKNHIHPKDAVKENIKTFKGQMKKLGFSFDWSREISTTDPEYYKWTQWQFLQFYKHGMAYKATVPVNWCPNCKTVLSNEDAAGGVCERCGTEVVQKEKSQWMLKMSEYAEDLLTGLDDTNFKERVKLGQINWIGKSTGVELDVNIVGGGSFSVFTTCIETVYGITFFVIAPDGKLIKELMPRVENKEEVNAYILETSKKSSMDRTELNKGKTGVEIKGIKAINPINGKEVPIFLGDFVLGDYGTGAVMAVPSHDQRDFEYAKEHNLEMVEVISGGDTSVKAFEKHDYLGKGCKLVNSEEFTGMTVEEAKEAITNKLEKEGIARRVNNYKMRDWIFSRQRFWGEPIPMIYCDKCGWVPVPEDQLPLVLPDVKDYEPGENGESPLAKHTEWTHTTCPHCGGPATRETDTMPQWAGSSWYYLRYMDPHNDKALASKESLEYWSPVDWYNGGMEHTTLHLLYSRFWHKFLYDIGVVPTKEPYAKRTSHGMILGSNGEKMSKSKGNVVNPDDVVNEYGADTLRVYEMFMGPFDQTAPWSVDSIRGCSKFLDRVWNMQEILVDDGTSEYSKQFEKMMHQAIKKVSSDIEEMKFNTSVSTFMTMVNEFYKAKKINKAEFRTFLQLLNPFAPHITEELNEKLGFTQTIAETPWPTFDEEKTKEDVINLPIQINGKLRANIDIAVNSDEETVKTAVHEAIKDKLDGKTIVKEIYVKNRIYNVVIK